MPTWHGITHFLGYISCIVIRAPKNEGGIGKYIPDAKEITLDPRDIARDISRVEGVDLPIAPEFWWTIHQQSFPDGEWIRKSSRVDREGLTV